MHRFPTRQISCALRYANGFSDLSSRIASEFGAFAGTAVSVEEDRCIGATCLCVCACVCVVDLKQESEAGYGNHALSELIITLYIMSLQECVCVCVYQETGDCVKFQLQFNQ